MRRIKVILAVVAAVATLMVMAAPAMAQSWWGGTPWRGSVDIEDCRWVWIPEWDDWFIVCELD